MDQETSLSVSFLDSLSKIAPEEWDACACPEALSGRPLDPFTTWRFLEALERSGSVGSGTGWEPHYAIVQQGNTVIACAPLYAKSHSQGEYIFDYNWAHAYENAGGRYYPKLQVAVPFTPASGRRFLTKPGFETQGMSGLIQAMVQLASENQISSLHSTFCTEAEALAGEAMGLMPRVTQQYHWLNEDYEDFAGFLGALSSRKRKTIRKEREKAQGFGGKIHVLTGDQIQPEHWDAFWVFYQDTGSRKWGTPYLTRAFFDIAQDTLRNDMVLVLAERNGHYIAGALNFIGRETLYGRYWGCTEHHPCLHFEACYYQAIDFAIAHGLKRVEAGAQGEHKLARGYLPTQTYSLHWIADKGFARAVSQYLDEEKRAIGEEIEILTEYGPFKKENREEQE